MRTELSMLAALLGVALAACEIGPRSGRGLRLPEGDVARGELAFRDLGCPQCHDVAGGAEFQQADRADYIVRLGGEVTHVETYGELVTSIIHPSHEISGRHPREKVADGERSRMRSFNEQMSVAQLVDLTAYLQSKYELRIEPVYIP